MIRTSRTAFAATVAALLLIAAPAAAQLEGGPAIGDAAPKVTTTDLDGRPVDLGRWLGKGPVFIEFWATWCESCRALKPRVDSAYAQYHDRVTFLGVDVAFNETVPGVRAWLAEHRPGFQVLYD
ncbi:MAG TPA: TlpA disulfide reductase family protein, partial [Gemmatimonadales bacterium]|nr:TlpA disulfide reductase family protein [Gemmatimonadales bacterium]